MVGIYALLRLEIFLLRFFSGHCLTFGDVSKCWGMVSAVGWIWIIWSRACTLRNEAFDGMCSTLR